MNTPNTTSQIAFGILLLIGSILLPYVIKNIRKESHLAPHKTERLQHRAWSNRPLLNLLITWISLYLLAATSGSFFYEDQLPTVRLIFTYLIYILIGAQIIHHQRTHSPTHPLGLTQKQLPQLRWALPLYLAFLPLLSLIALLNQLILSQLLHIETEHQLITQQMTQLHNPLHQLYILTSILIAPLYEEILFRGILFPKLIQKAGLTNALIITSLLFAGLHFHLPALLPLFSLSMLLSLVYWWSGSLWNCIAIHILFNAGSIALLLANN
jgi:membrane protease YdiL (CAAX protease family)